MKRTKVKQLKTIGIITIVLGSIVTFSNGIGAIIFFISPTSFDIKHLYEHPAFFTMAGALTLFGGILIIKLDKISIPITSFSTIFLGTLLLLMHYTHAIDPDIDSVFIISDYAFPFIISAPIITLIVFLIINRKHFN